MSGISYMINTIKVFGALWGFNAPSRPSARIASMTVL